MGPSSSVRLRHDLHPTLLELVVHARELEPSVLEQRRRAACRKRIVYWNTIYTQHALDDLPHDLAGDELAGLTPTLFEHVNPLGTYTFDTDRPAGQLRSLRAASAA
jgi:hypothetical protein